MSANGRNGSNGHFRVILSPTEVVATLIAAEEKYLTVPEAGPNDVVFQRSGVQKFRPVDFLTHMGQDVPGSYRGKPRVYFVPNSFSLRKMLKEKRDNEFTIAIRNGGRVNDLRLTAINRMIDVVTEMSARN